MKILPPQTAQIPILPATAATFRPNLTFEKWIPSLFSIFFFYTYFQYDLILKLAGEFIWKQFLVCKSYTTLAERMMTSSIKDNERLLLLQVLASHLSANNIFHNALLIFSTHGTINLIISFCFCLTSIWILFIHFICNSAIHLSSDVTLLHHYIFGADHCIFFVKCKDHIMLVG